MQAGIPGANENPLAYTGTQYNYVPCAWFTRDPTAADVNYPFMFIWGNSATGSMWIRTNSVTVWIELNSGTGVAPVPQGGTGRATLTNHAVIVGAGTNAVDSVGPGAAGTLLQGAGASADPAFTTATYPATTTIDQILYSSAANTVTGLATANNGTLVTSATGVPSILAGPGTSGQILQSNAAAAPSFSTAAYPATTAQGDLLLSSAANTITVLNKDTNATRYLGNTGSSNNAAWSQINLANGVTGILPVANGGNGVAMLEGTANTTDATPTTSITFPCGAVAGSYEFQIRATAFASVGASAPLAAGFFVTGCVRTTGAAAVLVAQTPVVSQEGDLSTSAVTIAVGSNNALIQVTGVAAYTVTWKVEAIYTFTGA